MKSFLILLFGFLLMPILIGIAGIYGYREVWHEITIGAVVGCITGYLAGSSSEV